MKRMRAIQSGAGDEVAARPASAAPAIVLPVAPLRSAYALGRGRDPPVTAKTTKF